MNQEIPNSLFYNCDRPLEILASRTIRCSAIFTGVSMSSWSELASHGPFKIAFRQSDWFNQFFKCHYPKSEVERNKFYDEVTNKLEAHAISLLHLGRIVKAHDMFADEQEWYSAKPVSFKIEDVIAVTFMTNAPNIHPRIARKARAALTTMPLYGERSVNDPYLRGAAR